MSRGDLHLDPPNQDRFPGRTEMSSNFGEKTQADQGSEVRLSGV